MMLCSYQVIFLLPHLISNCLFPKERIIHELLDLTVPNVGHTSLYCTVCVILDIGTSLHPDETVLCPLWKFPLVLRPPVVDWLVHRWEFWLRSPLHFPAL